MTATVVGADGRTFVYVTLFGLSDRLGSGRGKKRRVLRPQPTSDAVVPMIFGL